MTRARHQSRSRSCRWTATLLVLTSLVLLGCEPDAPNGRVRLATTTSTHNSGLLDELIPPFEKATGLKVDVLAVGTGQALTLGERGDVDLVLVHARSREDEFVASGAGVDRRSIMWNDFVIVGPPKDPAAIRGSSRAAIALATIADRQADFVSRGDDSGTHIRERALWKEAGVPVPTQPHYWSAGQGMGAVLLLAHQKDAYTLTDRGTFLAFADRLALEVLVEGDPELRNPYGAILVHPDRHSGVNHVGARKLLDYLTSPDGQSRIASFRRHGQRLFQPAQPVPGEQPSGRD